MGLLTSPSPAPLPICLTSFCRAQGDQLASPPGAPPVWASLGQMPAWWNRTHSRLAVPFSPPLPVDRPGSLEHIWDAASASRSCPAFFLPSGERHTAQPRTLAICKEGQSQAEQLSLRARKFWAWALAPRTTFPWAFPTLSVPRRGQMSRSSHLLKVSGKSAWE